MLIRNATQWTCTGHGLAEKMNGGGGNTIESNHNVICMCLDYTFDTNNRSILFYHKYIISVL